ncbi:MAG: prolyl aminopeptidase [Gammaproteobacteria bacterium]|nr:prolyl aminopeptidase [Gammaproteobacteria bacterium]
MRTLYPEIEPDMAATLDVDGHQVYYEVCGNPDGMPVVFLHGGPGSGCKPYHRQFYDPERYRIVLVDQRGSGRSTPYGRIEDNTTADLIADLEAIRGTLAIPRWLVVGGSWGATLALLYAEQHPKAIEGLILRGTFLARDIDLEWYLGGGVTRLFPDAWARFSERFGHSLARDLIDRCAAAVLEGDRETQLAATEAWADWTGELVMFSLNTPEREPPGDPDRMIAKAGIEMHYARNRYFISDNQILQDIGRLPAVPVTIIHGRRDITCTPEAAWRLHRAIPGSRLTMLRDAGHLAGETPMIDALVQATDAFLRTHTL